MIDWIISNKLDALAAAAITLIGGSYVPWINAAKKLLSVVRGGKAIANENAIANEPVSGLSSDSPPPPSSLDAHSAIHKLIDIIQTCRMHGDDDTADALSAMLPAVEISCCKVKPIKAAKKRG